MSQSQSGPVADRPGVCVPESTTLREALEALDATGLGVVVVTDDRRRLLSLATEGDVRRALLAGHGLMERVALYANARPVVGTDSMSRPELAALLTERVHHVPVVDRENVLVDLLLHDQRSIIPVSEPSIGEREIRYVTDAVLSGWVSSQGKYIAQFEELLAAFCDTGHAVATCNGTCALQLALAALAVGPGDEVIVPALTFAATAAVVVHAGATPVFVDAEWTSWNMDPAAVAAAITPRTKAIMAVHLYGQPCSRGIFEIGEKTGVPVIEDAAEAPGARLDGRPVGGLGSAGCLSFFGNKILTTGEGGAVVCDDAELARRLRVLRDHGMSKERRYWHDVVGFNFRMTNLQAALGVAQLERASELISRRELMRRQFATALEGLPVWTPEGWTGAEPVCWLYTVIMDETTTHERRDEIVERLCGSGVECRPVFWVLPSMPPFFEADWEKRYPVARSISRRGISLPTYHGLNETEIMRIASALGEELGR